MSEDDILRLARKRFAVANEAEDEMKRLAEEDLRFKIGDQWPEEERKAREEDHRPMLRVNRLQQHIKQVVNQQRMNRPGIQVDAVSDDAEDQIAEVMEGMVRNIENISNAEYAYDQGYEQAVDAGFGHWRVTTEYASDDGFEQDIYIRPMKNRFSVLFDPDTELSCKEDARYCFVFDRLPKEEFADRYPNADISAMNEEPVGNEFAGWWGKDDIKYAEYFYKENIEELMQLWEYPDGTTQINNVAEEARALGASQDEWIKAHEMETRGKVMRERRVERTAVKWCRHTGVEIIEKADWAGMYIPIVRVVGDSTYLEGRDYISGLVRWAKDPVMAYNYWITAATEQLALQPKAPFIIADEQLAEYKQWWVQANRKNLAYLPYKHVNGLPRPDRVSPPQTPTGLMNMLAVASDDIKATTGIYDASLGARGNETSGIAIAERQEQGDISSFHYVDNLNRAIQYTGKIIVDLIPKIYDTERAVRILGRDGQANRVMVNAAVDGRELNLSKGRYDVHIEAGPSFATKRKETAATILEALKVAPGYAPILMPMLFKNVDAAGADEVAQALESQSPVGPGGEMPDPTQMGPIQ